jgi:hypothetical protein
VTRVVALPLCLEPDEWPPGLVRYHRIRLDREVLTPREWRRERRWSLRP